LTDRNDLYAITRVSGQGCAFGGRDNIRLNLGVKSKKPSPKLAGIGTLQPNRRNRKIAIYQSSMKIFASNLPLNTKQRWQLSRLYDLAHSSDSQGHILLVDVGVTGRVLRDQTSVRRSCEARWPVRLYDPLEIVSKCFWSGTDSSGRSVVSW